MKDIADSKVTLPTV